MNEVSPVTPAPPIDKHDHTIAYLDPLRQAIWTHVSRTPLHNMWDFQGASPWVILKRTASSFMDDNLLARAAELGYYFLFALFPTLVFASSIVGLMAKKASTVYVGMLHYLAIVIPQSAYQQVMETFNQTTQSATGGKIIFGLAAALWSASVGFAAIQDTANVVYKARETRPYWKAKLQAIGVTLMLSIVITLTLAVLLFADYLIHLVEMFTWHHWVAMICVVAMKGFAWICVVALLMLLFAVIYYYAPDVENKKWHWLTPGAAIGIAAWLAASMGLRVYLHYFPSYTATYGSLGAVIILLTWFYITGLTLLAGAEINSEIQAAVAEKKLKEAGLLPEEAKAEEGPAVA
jgi:membrane protein